MSQDLNLHPCDARPLIALPLRGGTCAFQIGQIHISGMYVFGTIGNAEFIVVGDVLAATPAALYRAERDATYVALHEATHISHLIELAHGCFGMTAKSRTCHTAMLPRRIFRSSGQYMVMVPSPIAHIDAVNLVLLDARTRRPVSAVKVGAKVILRVRWMLSRLLGKSHETITWRIMKQGRMLINDHITDGADAGTSYQDDVIKLDSNWARRGRYTAIGMVKVDGRIKADRLTFSVVRD